MRANASVSSRILSLLLAPDSRKYEQVFLDMMRDKEGQDLLAHYAVDIFLWWHVHDQTPTFDVKELLLACVGLQSATVSVDTSSESRLRWLLMAQLMDGAETSQTPLAVSDAAMSLPEIWNYVSRASVAAIVIAHSWSRVSVARQVCRSLIECEFTTAARALAVLRRLGNSRGSSAVQAEIDRFEEQATAYIIGLAATQPISWLSWEAQLMAAR